MKPRGQCPPHPPGARGGGWMGVAWTAPAPSGLSFHAPSCRQSHLVPTLVTSFSPSVSGVELGVWGGGWLGGARAAQPPVAPPLPWGPLAPSPGAALPMASDPRLLSLLCLERPGPRESLSQTSREKGRGRRGRNFQTLKQSKRLGEGQRNTSTLRCVGLALRQLDQM